MARASHEAEPAKPERAARGARPAKRKKAESDLPSFAVAFGGGGARGLAHIQVIEALDELGIRPVAISGSSIGAIMGAAMAAGMTGAEIHEYARGILGKRAEVVSRMWRAKPAAFDEMIGFRMTQFNIERILKAFLPEIIPERFEDLKIPLKVTGTDYFGHTLKVFEEGELISALGASAAIPALFRPVKRDGRIYVDGGLYNPVPFDLVEGAADITIAIDVVGAPTDERRKTPTALDLMFGSSQLMMQAITAYKLKLGRPQIYLRPPVSNFRVLDFMKIDAVMAETASIKDELKHAVDAALKAHAKAARG